MAQSPRIPSARPGMVSLLFAWAGACLFVVSLAVFLYSYEVTFGRAADGSSRWAAFINIGMFTAFALHHSVLARASVKRALERRIPLWLQRSLFTWLASALFLAVCLAWQPVAGILFSLEGGWRLLGFAAQLAGLAFVAAGSRAVDVLDLAGVRPLMAERRGEAWTHVTLRTRGVFRLVRHPIYLGWALFVFGTPAMTATRAVFAFTSTLYLIGAIPLEERALVTEFGRDYVRYRERTRFRMIPGIW